MLLLPLSFVTVVVHVLAAGVNDHDVVVANDLCCCGCLVLEGCVAVGVGVDVVVYVGFEF